MGNFSERLREVIHALNIEDKTFAEAADVQKATLSGYLNLGRLPNQKTLSLWVQKFGIDAHWLLTGEGEMFRTGQAMTIRALRPHAKAESACVLDSDEKTPVGQVVPVHAAAAGGPGMERWEPEPLCHVCIPLTYYRESILIVQIDGRSMEPEIRSGAFVGLDTNQRELVAGEKFGVRIPYEGLTVKRVFIDPGSRQLVLRSINPEHPEMRVPLDEHDGLIVGRAVWVMQEL